MAPKRTTRKANNTATPPAVPGMRRSARVQKPAAKSAPISAPKATGRAASKKASKAAPKTSRKPAKKAATQPTNDAIDDDSSSDNTAPQPPLSTLPTAPIERATQEEIDEDEFGAANHPALADDVEVDRLIRFQREGTPEDAVLRLRLRIFRDPDFRRLGYYTKIVLRHTIGSAAAADNDADTGAPTLNGDEPDVDSNGTHSAAIAPSADNVSIPDNGEVVGYIHAWRIDKPTKMNRDTSSSTWNDTLLTPKLNSINDAGRETALCLRALFTQKGQARKTLGEQRQNFLDDNSLLFIQMVHIYSAYQRKGLLRHILSAFNEALGRLPEWFVFTGPIVLVPGAPAEGTQRGAAWADVDVEDAEEVLTNAYARHGGYAVWAHNAKVGTDVITVMGRTVPEGAFEGITEAS